MASGVSGGSVCPLVLGLVTDTVTVAGWTVVLLLAPGAVGLLVVAPGAARLAVVLGRRLEVASVLEVEGAEAMVSRIQPFSLVMRVYTPGFCACAQPTPQLTMPAR